MRIIGAVVSPGLTGFYFDDQKAIKMGRRQDALPYWGNQLQMVFLPLGRGGSLYPLCFFWRMAR
ncbi:hypothetical protein N752_04645 [Desulforamulus aquiferis]|nr:hypothetical protein [Desulforamulus aquiferis]RYD06180.1 hypothetical protein N752_04645 [Desulforamulus aquiferis]